MKVNIDGEYIEFDMEKLLEDARIEERNLHASALKGDSIAAMKLLSRFIDHGSCYDDEVRRAIELGSRNVMARVVEAATVANRKFEVQPLMFFGDIRRPTRTKGSDGVDRIALRIAREEMLAEDDAKLALTTQWEGTTIGKGAKGARLPRKNWPLSFDKVERKLAAYIERKFRGAPLPVCITYARMSFGNTSWYPYENPEQPIVYPSDW